MVSVSTPRRIYLTWKDIDGCACSIAHQVARRKTHPRAILGVANGGVIPASMLFYRYGIANYEFPLLSFVRCQSYLSEGKRGELSITLSNEERVRLLALRYLLLIVDDITDSGTTLAALSRMFPEAQTASFIHKETSMFEPTYYGRADSGRANNWYVFPWERPFQMKRS